MKTALAVLALLASACATLRHGTIHGSGLPLEEPRPIEGEFDEVRVAGAVLAEIEVGPAASVVVRGDENIVPHIRTRLSGRTLVVDSSDHDLRPEVQLVVEITLPGLASLQTSGTAAVFARGVDAEHFDVASSGASSLRVAGRTGKLDARASGACVLHLLALSSDRAVVQMSGASHVEVHASELLDARMSGASVLLYTGRPGLSLATSGASSVQWTPMQAP